MKTLILLIASLYALSAQAQISSACLNEAKNWIYSNTPVGAADAATAALNFCSAGGDASCLNPAKNWIYSNTPVGAADASKSAVQFCKYGVPSCLQTTKDWLYSNTSVNAAQAAEQAIQTCGQPKRCQ